MKSDIDILFSRVRSLAATKPERDMEHLRRVRSLPCFVCGSPHTEPHHVFGSYGSGMKECKTSDLYTVPICRECHAEVEKPENKFEVLVALMETLRKLST